MSDGQQHKVFQSRKQNVWILYLFQCLFFLETWRPSLQSLSMWEADGRQLSAHTCL